MSNPMRYIRSLEAAGFNREQADAQVQVVLDAIEDGLMTKSDFAVERERMDSHFKSFHFLFAQNSSRIEEQLAHFDKRIDERFAQFDEKIETRFAQFDEKIETRFAQFDAKIEARFAQHDEKMEQRITQSEAKLEKRIDRLEVDIKELEYRLIIRLGVLTVSCTTIAVALLAWLIKI